MKDKNGPKIKPIVAEDGPAPMPEWFKGKSPELVIGIEGKVVQTREGGQTALTGRRITISQLAEALQQPLGTFVMDQTGLQGVYYFAFLFAREGILEDTDASPLAVALQDKLGLKLEPHNIRDRSISLSSITWRRLPPKTALVYRFNKT